MAFEVVELFLQVFVLFELRLQLFLYFAGRPKGDFRVLLFCLLYLECVARQRVRSACYLHFDIFAHLADTHLAAKSLVAHSVLFHEVAIRLFRE